MGCSTVILTQFSTILALLKIETVLHTFNENGSDIRILTFRNMRGILRK